MDNNTPAYGTPEFEKLKIQRDFNNTIAYARKEGFEEGRKERKKMVCRNLILDCPELPDLTDKKIADIIGESTEFVKDIRENLSKK